MAKQKRETPVSPTQLTEKQFQAQVIALASMSGYFVYHTFDSRRSAAGFPDLAMVRPGHSGKPGRFLLVELKTEKGRIRPAQVQWLDMLGTCPSLEVYLWRPHQIELITEILCCETREAACDCLLASA